MRGVYEMTEAATEAHDLRIILTLRDMEVDRMRAENRDLLDRLCGYAGEIAVLRLRLQEAGIPADYPTRVA